MKRMPWISIYMPKTLMLVLLPVGRYIQAWIIVVKLSVRFFQLQKLMLLC